jgi:hypothetical protein
MHHSLLHLAEGKIANVNIDLALAADDSEAKKDFQMLLSLSEALQSQMFKPRERKFRVHLMHFSLSHE